MYYLKKSDYTQPKKDCETNNSKNRLFVMNIQLTSQEAATLERYQRPSLPCDCIAYVIQRKTMSHKTHTKGFARERGRGEKIVEAISGRQYGNNSASNAAVKSSSNQLVNTGEREMERLQLKSDDSKKKQAAETLKTGFCCLF